MTSLWKSREKHSNGIETEIFKEVGTDGGGGTRNDADEVECNEVVHKVVEKSIVETK